MTHRSSYRVAVSSHQLVSASGEHMGQAIEAATKLTGGHATAIEAGEVPLGESVGKASVTSLGDAPPLPAFHWPTGVLPTIAGAPALAGAQRGWVTRSDAKLLVIEAQTDGPDLTDLFLGIVERLPAADNLEVRVQNHFEDAGVTDVWLTSRINAKKVLRLVDDLDVDLIGNGHLEVSVYVRAHNATLRLTEHKTVVWLAEDHALEAEVTRWLAELKVPRVDSLVTVRDAPHFHYRPGKSRDRKKLGEELFRQRLRRVDSIKAPS